MEETVWLCNREVTGRGVIWVPQSPLRDYSLDLKPSRSFHLLKVLHFSLAPQDRSELLTWQTFNTDSSDSIPAGF